MPVELAPELQLGPKAFVESPTAASRISNADQAEAYTRWLATHHYENFHVVSWLLPKRLHQDFFNVYAYCRWADDLGDEFGDPARSMELLDWWGRELDDLYRGRASHPVFLALHRTVERQGIPKQPFADLLRAFRQDQQVTRYQTWGGVLDYCVYSANPVGRLILYLCGYRDAERQELSDATCTALQLANFWQDVTVDWAKDRVYIPREVLARHGSSVEDIAGRRFTLNFRAAIWECVDKAQDLFDKGLPLASTLDRSLALDIDLFSRGGMRVLEKIRARDYNVLAGRPAISKLERVALLLGALGRQVFRRRA